MTPHLKKRGRSFSPTHQPRGTPWQAHELAALGSATDGTLAAALGRSRLSVYLKRRALGIPAACPPGRPTNPLDSSS